MTPGLLGKLRWMGRTAGIPAGVIGAGPSAIARTRDIEDGTMKTNPSPDHRRKAGEP
jgi:hypothetical protein